MKNDIKKKFIDILFEPEEDEEEEVVVAPVIEPRPAKKQENAIKAKDILYRKPDTSAPTSNSTPTSSSAPTSSSTFINLDETSKKVKEVKETANPYGDYELSSQISPIFGVIKENKPESSSSSVATVKANDSLVSRPDSSHLEIITSPIYGYGNRKDFDGDRDGLAEVFSIRNEEDELHNLFEDEVGYDEHTYDDIQDNSTTDDDINLFGSYFGEE